MNATPETTTATKGGVTRRDIENVERALIDHSARGPVLTFFTTAIFWLLVSVVLGYIASKKLHAPDFVLGPEWLYELLHMMRATTSIFEHLTYGRVWPAYTTALIYGWCSLGRNGRGDMAHRPPHARLDQGARRFAIRRVVLECGRSGRRSSPSSSATTAGSSSSRCTAWRAC